MSQILVEHDGRREVREFPGLFTIGRRPDCAVVARGDIAPVQARIDHVDGRFLLTNLGKAGCVFVNGQSIDTRHIVEPYDVIEIGDVRIGLVSADPPPTLSGGRLHCSCGAVLKIRPEFAGQVKRCPRCRTTYEIPVITDPVPSLRTESGRSLGSDSSGGFDAEGSSDPEVTCPVCQCPISGDEPWISCPGCGLPHHSECWNENFGCSAYGCSQVKILKQGPDIRISLPHSDPGTPAEITPCSHGAASGIEIPWEFMSLALSVVGFFLGTVTFGVPCLIAGGLIAAFILARPVRSNLVVMILAIVVCAVGFLVGFVISIHLFIL